MHPPESLLAHCQPPIDPRTAGYQTWSQLLFLHWRVPARLIQPLLPPQLTVDTWDGDAWVGVVPFSMQRVRPWWAPPIPGISWFLETNVRTYAVDRDGRHGVWFFSLDANQRLAVWIARRFWHLPYYHASLQLTTTTAAERSDSLAADQAAPVRITCQGHRRTTPEADYRIELQVDRAQPARTARPGTLDYFLVERYLLFAASPDGRLRLGRVHHVPYACRPVQLAMVQQSLTTACGISSVADRQPDHAVYADGVHVRVSPLQICADQTC